MSLVTVITTFYNAEKTIEYAIESILSQTYRQVEYIIVDDGSDDGSLDVVKKFRDDRIIILTPGRIGRVAALNLALEKSKGEYICILDADDIALENRIEIQLKAFKKHKEVSLIYSNAVLIDNNSNIIGKTSFPVDYDSIINSLYNLSPFPHSSVMFEKQSIIEIGGYNQRCEKSIDFNLYIELQLNSKKIIGISDPLISLRVSTNSWGKSDESAQQIFYGMLALANLYIYEKAGKNFMRSSDKEYEIFKSQFIKWFDLKSFKNRANAKKCFHTFEECLREIRIIRAFNQLYKAFIYDPIFWSYKGVNFSYPNDLNKFLNFLEKEPNKLLKIIND